MAQSTCLLLLRKGQGNAERNKKLILHKFLLCFQVSSWFQRLYPDTSFTPSHIKRLIQKAEKEFDSFTGAAPALDSFLRDAFSLHLINNELNKIGIDWTNIFNAAGFVPQSSLTCTLNLTNAIVVSLENF